MENDTLVAYITTERARGVTDDNLRTELLTKGWGASEVDAAMGRESLSGKSLPSLGVLLSSSWEILIKQKEFFMLSTPVQLATMCIGLEG